MCYYPYFVLWIAQLDSVTFSHKECFARSDQRFFHLRILCSEAISIRNVMETPLKYLRLEGDLINMYHYLQTGCKEDGCRLFSVVPRAWTRGNGHRIEHRRFFLNIRKHFTLWRMEHWNMLPREAEEYPSLEIFKSCMDMVLGNLLKSGLA